MTPSDSAAAAFSTSRSARSPRRTLAPSADTAAADSSDRARPVTSWPAAISSGMTYEPAWPEGPVTKTCMAMLLAKNGLCARSAEKTDADRKVGVLDGADEEAQRQYRGVLQRPRHEQRPGISGRSLRLSMTAGWVSPGSLSSPHQAAGKYWPLSKSAK